MRFYTFRRNVPLQPGQHLAFKWHKGYYAAGTPTPKPKWKPAPKNPAPPTERERFCHWLRWGLAHEGLIHYEQRRPIPVHLPQGQLPLWTDCSGYITLAAKWAAVADPNGRGFDGDGYTGDMLDHCREINAAQAKPGDLIVYGNGSGHHVVGIVGLGVDYLCVSHGQERGPILVHHRDELRFQGGVARFLSFLP